MISILLFCESRYPIDRKRIRKTVEAVFGERGVSDKIEVAISIVGDRKMRKFNKKYRDMDASTDVLSFSQIEGPPSLGEKDRSPDGVLRLGDVIVSFPQARKNASKKDILINEEIDFLIRHGLLHLLGIHHE